MNTGQIVNKLTQFGFQCVPYEKPNTDWRIEHDPVQFYTPRGVFCGAFQNRSDGKIGVQNPLDSYIQRRLCVDAFYDSASDFIFICSLHAGVYDD